MALSLASRFQHPLLGRSLGNSLQRSTTFASQPAGAYQSLGADDVVVKTHTEGELGTPEFKMYFKTYRVGAQAKLISPWHDIRCFTGPHTFGLCMYVNEIPKGTRPKMECMLELPHNPLVQDVKKGQLRNFTYGDLPFNYGFIPRTWESPDHKSPSTGLPGDNDPLDVVELSETPLEMGEISEIKVLGCYALIDEGETDWKILGLRKSHPLAEVVHDVEQIELYFPGMLERIHDWFKMYKTTDGKPENSFAFGGEPQSAAFATEVIQENHKFWQDMTPEQRKKFHVPAVSSL